MSRTSIPEQGQLVEVRQRRYVVTEVRQSTLPPDPRGPLGMLPDFSDTERDHLARNRDSLRARLAQIPGEIVGETDAIRARYANPSPRLFPVAVTFLVPERLTH